MVDVVTVQPALPEDAARIAAIYWHYVTSSTISFEEEAPDGAEITRRMLAAPRLPWLKAVRAGRVVGYCYASPHRARAAYRWSADVSVYLDVVERGLGTGRLLYEALLAEVRDLGYVTAFAGIALPNDPSVRLHESMDFTHLGVFRTVGYKHGAWLDVGWWQLSLLDPPPNEPAAPRAWRPPTPG